MGENGFDMRRLLPFAYAAVVAAAPCAAAQPGVHLEHHTSAEVRAAVAAGKDTILVPIGGTEQHGDAMALGKHNVRARILAERIAASLGDALVAPVVAYVPEGGIDPPSGHMKGAGTITIPEAAFEKTLEWAARSFRHHGFKHVVFLGDHGGYQRSLRRVAGRLNREWKRPVVVIPDGYYREVPHAGVEDTSLTLGLDPSLVRQAPPGASAVSGREAADRLVERTVKAIRESRRR